MTAFDWAFAAFLYLGWGNAVVCHRVRINNTMPDWCIAGLTMVFWLLLLVYFNTAIVMGEWRRT